MAGFLFYVKNVSDIASLCLCCDANIALYAKGSAEMREIMKTKCREEQVHCELCGQCLVIYITSDLDHHTVSDLREKADRMIQAGNARHLIFDFEDVDFMDSSGIGLIMGRYKKVLFLGGKVAVSHVGENVDRIFRISGLYQIIEKYDTPEEAVDKL